MDPLTLLAGAAILAVGLLVGHVTGRRDATRRRDKPAEPICGCKHHWSMHDPKTRECKVETVGKVNYVDSWLACPCRQYTGPEPISSVWVPPAAVESGDR